MEKARLPSPAEHLSYKKHRRELWTQILLPISLTAASALAVIVLTTVAAFRPQGDVERWAAISTIWIVIPLMAAGLVLLIVFISLIYGVARLLAFLPPCTEQAQRFAWRVEGAAKRGADLAVKPILVLEGVTATIRRLFGKK